MLLFFPSVMSCHVLTLTIKIIMQSCICTRTCTLYVHLPLSCRMITTFNVHMYLHRGVQHKTNHVSDEKKMFQKLCRSNLLQIINMHTGGCLAICAVEYKRCCLCSIQFLLSTVYAPVRYIGAPRETSSANSVSVQCSL